MPDDYTHRVALRCPVCFSRENDVVLFADPHSDQYYCTRCSFTGNADHVRDLYADLRKKYHWMKKRVALEEQRRL